MMRMIWRRLGIGLVTLWVVSLIMFAGTEILPGDVAEIMLGMEATPESLAALRSELGLNRPAYIRYFEWLGDMARADLGMSLAGRGNGRSVGQYFVISCERRCDIDTDFRNFRPDRGDVSRQFLR